MWGRNQYVLVMKVKLNMFTIGVSTNLTVIFLEQCRAALSQQDMDIS